MLLWVILIIVILQRLSELLVAKRNERWMKSKGAKEFGQRHYKYMVLIHIGFFVSLIAEFVFFKKTIHPYWLILLSCFIFVQLARVWVIASLGKYWNTKIIVLPGIHVVKKGPFKYIKHPNYLIVTIELIILPLLFQTYITLVVFFILNQLILAVRIPLEESALRANTDYIHQFK